MSDTFIAYIEYKAYCERENTAPVPYKTFSEHADSVSRRPGYW